MATIQLTCPICHKDYQKEIAYYNQTLKRGGNSYCSKPCSHIGRKLQSDKHLKTPEQLKAEKAEYDKVYREKNLERIKKAKAEAFKIDYAANPEKYREERKRRMPQHVIYCRLPKARKKEKEARHRRLGIDKTKKCLICKCDKKLVEFEFYDVFADNRNYMCKDCEDKEAKELQITMREVLQTIRSGLYKHESTLTIRDYTPYPYLIEAHKYSLLLKRLTK